MRIIENVLFIIIIWFFFKKLDIFDINENDKLCINILLREVLKILFYVLWIMFLVCCFFRCNDKNIIRMSRNYVYVY